MQQQQGMRASKALDVTTTRHESKQGTKATKQWKEKPKIRTKPIIKTLTKQQCNKKKKITIGGVKTQHLFMQIFKVCRKALLQHDSSNLTLSFQAAKPWNLDPGKRLEVKG